MVYILMDGSTVSVVACKNQENRDKTLG